MNDYEIGDTVQMTGAVMTGNVGTVVSIDQEREKYLVRVGGVTQYYFAAGDLRRFGS